MSDFAGKRFFSFLIFGGVNTAVTYLLYLWLSDMMHYQTAYFIAYISGIVLAYLFNLRYVFEATNSLKKFVLYPLIYVVQYLAGAFLMYLFLQILYLPNAVAPLIVIIMLLPISYLLNKKVLLN